MDASALIPCAGIRLAVGFAAVLAMLPAGACTHPKPSAPSVGPSPVSTTAPRVPADVAAAVRQRVINMWPDINKEATYGGGPQKMANEVDKRLAPSVPDRFGSIGTLDEARALGEQYRQMKPPPDPDHAGVSGISLVSQSPPTNFSTIPPSPSFSVSVCYSFQIAPIVDGVAGAASGTEFATAVLTLRNPSQSPNDLADTGMWGLFSVTHIQRVNGCETD